MEGKPDLRVLIFALLCFWPFAAKADPVVDIGQGTFRYFVWGVSPEDVKKFETAGFYKEEGDSLYFLELPGPKDFRRLIRYDFENGKLWRGVYDYQELKNPNPGRFLDMYEDLKRMVSKSYGDPVKVDYIWKNQFYKNYPQFWGRSLLSGDLKFYTEWKTGETKAYLTLAHEKPVYKIVFTAEKAGTAPETVAPDNFLNLPGLSAERSIQPAQP